MRITWWSGPARPGASSPPGCRRTARKVVLLEAGPPDRDPMIHIPAGVLRVLNNAKINWNYLSEGEPGTAGRALAMAARQDAWAAPARSTACSMCAATRPITTAGRRWAAAAGATTRCCRSSRKSETYRGTRRPGIPQPGRPADRRGLPHDPALDPRVRRGGARGRLRRSPPTTTARPRKASPIRR